MPISTDKAAEQAAIKAILLDAIDQVTEAFVSSLLEKMPVEGGHGHEAFSTAVEGVVRQSGGTGLARTSQVVGRHRGDRSGDPEAQKRGEGVFAQSADWVYVELSAALPFLRKLELGGTIKPGDLAGNIGPKASPDTFGQLYAPRLPTRGGLLAWWDNSGFHMAPKRTVTGLKFFAKSANEARARAKQLGLKRVK